MAQSASYHCEGLGEELWRTRCRVNSTVHTLPWFLLFSQEIEPRVAEELCRLFPADELIDLRGILHRSGRSSRRARTSHHRHSPSRRSTSSSRRHRHRHRRTSGGRDEAARLRLARLGTLPGRCLSLGRTVMCSGTAAAAELTGG